MAVLKMLPSGSHSLLSIYTKCWNITLRTVSKSKIIEDLIGCPEKPKKPRNPFIRFLTSVGPDYAAQNDSPKDVFKALGSAWRDMTDKEKEKYLKEYEKETAEYKEKYKAYQESLTSTQKQKLKKLKEVIDKAIMNFPHSKTALKNLNRPSHPRSSFVLFCLDSRQKHGTSCFKNIKCLAEEWRNLSDSEKKKYKTEFEKSYKDYKVNLEKWELKMMQEGNIEALSLKTLKELKGKF